MDVHFITIFPDFFRGPLESGILYAAAKKGLVSYNVVNLRDFAKDRHRTVDDYPYGGGPGMILMAPPIVEAVESIAGGSPASGPAGRTVIMPTPGGPVFTQEQARSFSEMKELIFVCGRYKGVDERVFDLVKPIPVSIGDYVLSGGEGPALVILESLVRLLPGALGDKDSAESDSFSTLRGGRLDAAYYTRPEIYREKKVPETLLSGHHAEIEAWRVRSAEERTRRYRPDLLKKSDLENSKR